MGVAPRERHGNEGPKVETGDAQASSTPTEPTRIRSRRAGLIGQPVGRVTRRLPGGEIPPGPPLVAEETLRTTEWSGHAPPADFGPCGRSRTPERERSGRARNGRRGAAAVTQNQLPTRSNPSKGQAHGSLPRTIRGGPTARCGAPTTDAGSTRRTPDLVPAANMLEAGVRRHRRGGRNHEDGPRRKMASTCRSEGHATPAETRAETPRAGRNEPGETRKRGPKKDEKFQERKDESPSDRGRRPADPARTPETPQRVRRWIGIERNRAAPRHESPRGGRRRRRTTRWASGKDQRPTREPGEAGNCATSSPSERQGWEDETRKGIPSSPTGSSANL